MLKLSGNLAVICEINPSRTQSAASTRHEASAQAAS